MKDALETLADLREKLNGMQDDLERLAHDNRAHSRAITEALTPLFSLRDALYTLEGKMQG